MACRVPQQHRQSCLASNQTLQEELLLDRPHRLLLDCMASLLVDPCLRLAWPSWHAHAHLSQTPYAGPAHKAVNPTLHCAGAGGHQCGGGPRRVLNQEVDYVAEGAAPAAAAVRCAAAACRRRAAAATAPQLHRSRRLLLPPQPAAAAAPPWPAASHAPAPQVSSESAATVHARHIQHSPVASSDSVVYRHWHDTEVDV